MKSYSKAGKPGKAHRTHTGVQVKTAEEEVLDLCLEELADLSKRVGLTMATVQKIIDHYGVELPAPKVAEMLRHKNVRVQQ